MWVTIVFNWVKEYISKQVEERFKHVAFALRQDLERKINRNIIRINVLNRQVEKLFTDFKELREKVESLEKEVAKK